MWIGGRLEPYGAHVPSRSFKRSSHHKKTMSPSATDRLPMLVFLVLRSVAAKFGSEGYGLPLCKPLEGRLQSPVR